MTHAPGLREALVGVGVTPVTPFSESLEVDLEGLGINLEFVLEAGVRLLYPCGNTGEFNALSLEEWTAVVETTCATARGRGVVAPGVGQGLSTALEMLRRVGDLGCSGALLMPPHPAFVSEEGLDVYYRRLASASPVPVILYKRGGWPSNDLLVALAVEGNVAGCKYGDPDLVGFARVAAQDPTTAWTCGLAELWAPFFHLAGSRGFTSGLANFAPPTALGLFEALNAGDYALAMKIRETCRPFEEIRARDNHANVVAAIKTAMDFLGLVGGRVRPPLRDLDRASANAVKVAIASLDVRLRAGEEPRPPSA